jgi:hypothetical protein
MFMMVWREQRQSTCVMFMLQGTDCQHNLRISFSPVVTTYTNSTHLQLYTQQRMLTALPPDPAATPANDNQH